LTTKASATASASAAASTCRSGATQIAPIDGTDAPIGGTDAPAGVTRILDGVATVSAEVGSAGCVGLLYPHKSLSPTREGSLPDVWSGFDAYRDRLLGTFGRIKFGRGLRFFLDPLCHPIGLTGETEFVVPDSPQFRLEWEAYLSRRYTDIDALMTAWGLLDRDIKDFKHATSLLPLWPAGRGVPFLLDTAAETRLPFRNS
jgi:hypothetical protein